MKRKQRSYRYCYMDALHGRYLKGWRKGLTATTQECCEQYWTGPGGSTPQSSSCTAAYHPSRKLSKLDEPDMLDTAGEVETSSLGVYSYGPLYMAVMYSYGPLYIPEQKQGDQLEPTYSSSVSFRDVKIKIPDRNCDQGMWVMSRTGSVGWGFWDSRKSSELSSCLRKRESRFRARRGQTNLCATGAARWLGWELTM